MHTEGRGESGKRTYIGCDPENSRKACEHGSGQALPGLSVVFEQMGKETCSLNIVISSLVDITTKLGLWSGRHMIAQENCGEKDKRIRFLIGKYIRRGWSQSLCLGKGAQFLSE